MKFLGDSYASLDLVEQETVRLWPYDTNAGPAGEISTNFPAVRG
jgi:hypothetical protein